MSPDYQELTYGDMCCSVAVYDRAVSNKEHNTVLIVIIIRLLDLRVQLGGLLSSGCMVLMMLLGFFFFFAL